MSETMEISQETLETIGSYVKGNLAGWIKEVVPQTVAQLSPDTEARLIRMEESIKGQQELMKQGFEQMEKRFEQIDRRFEQVDKRFEQQREEFVSRFEQVDRRFEQIDKRLDEQRVEFLSRFEQVDRRLEELRTDFNTRFDRTARFFGIVLTILLVFVGYGTFLG